MRRFALLVTILAIASCDSPRETVRRGEFDAEAWRPPADSEIPHDSLGVSIARGRALVLHTTDSLPAYAPGNIRCTNCHLDAGRNTTAGPLTGSYARFPKYLDRTGAVIGLADRINYCFTRSLAGSKLPVESREMQNMIAYIAWISRDVPVGGGSKLPGAGGIPVMEQQLDGDSARGYQVYSTKCALCHLPSGEGNPAMTPAIPALWGAKSFSVGASMARRSKAAAFIYYNMPFGAGKTLQPQEAYDVAAYITSLPRPDSPGKERDWPAGNAPADVPYQTKGHQAYLPPPTLPRANPQQAIVATPLSVKR